MTLEMYVLAFVFVIWTIFIGIDLYLKEPVSNELHSLKSTADELDRILKYENEQIEKLKKNVEMLNNLNFPQNMNNEIRHYWTEPIPVLVFACKRDIALKVHLNKLIRLRPSAERFPIIVSQDCDDQKVRIAIKQFGDKVQYTKHPAGGKFEKTSKKIQSHLKPYYFIARHYKLALDYVFKNKNHTSVIITEDDLDIGVDFFEYFSSTRYLLDRDPKLWCVSAWNDNGKREVIDVNAHSKLYRSDFFPGLGWMMTSKLWKELSPIWPSGFWDDWMRHPERRKDRQCIRPEISRTGMTKFGKVGASQGLFFEKHLRETIVNAKPVNFDSLNLDFLLEDEYNRTFHEEVYKEAELKSLEEAVSLFTFNQQNYGKKIRIEYNGNEDFIYKADTFHLMNDFKAGVPRTAYNGIVTFFVKGVRVFLVPDRTKITGYNPEWTVPPSSVE